MKLVVDCRILSTDHHHGLSRYGASITCALAELTPLTVIINDKRQLKHLPADIPYLMAPAPSFHTQRKVVRMLNDLGADVVYSPTQFFTVGRANFRIITSLHDTNGFDIRHPLSADVPRHQRLLWDVFHATKHPPACDSQWSRSCHHCQRTGQAVNPCAQAHYQANYCHL